MGHQLIVPALGNGRLLIGFPYGNHRFFDILGIVSDCIHVCKSHFNTGIGVCTLSP